MTLRERERERERERGCEVGNKEQDEENLNKCVNKVSALGWCGVEGRGGEGRGEEGTGGKGRGEEGRVIT